MILNSVVYQMGGAGGALKIQVNVETGSTVTATKDGHTYTGAETSTPGIYEIEVPEYGTYTVTATKGGQSASDSVTVSEENINFSYVYVNGVCWDYSNQSTALTRLTYLNDPNHYVTTNITTEPSPAVGTGFGSSPMDTMMPWMGMEEYNIINGVVGPKYDESGFSRTTNDTVVYIPEFYYKVIDDSTNSKRYFYIADKAVTGFSVHPGSGKYIGRYETGASYVSKSGLAPLVSITRATARTGSKNKGTGWRQQDFAARMALTLLYIVEFSDWNSQSKIGRGYVDGNSAAINTGATDAMTYHTGRPSGTDGKTAIQYRGVENPWGNVWEFVDGFNASNRKVYICIDPSKYADDTSTGYTDSGITMPTASGSYISKLDIAPSAPWALIPSEVNGSESTYVTDGCWTSTGWTVLIYSGDWNRGSLEGVSLLAANSGSSSTGITTGTRLLFDPS